MVEDVAAVAQGIDIGMRAERRGGLAVGIIPVAGCNVAVDIHQPDHVALGIGDVVVDIAVLQQHEGRTVLVIEEVQYVVPVSLTDQLAAGVVRGTDCHGRQIALAMTDFSVEGSAVEIPSLRVMNFVCGQDNGCFLCELEKIELFPCPVVWLVL